MIGYRLIAAIFSGVMMGVCIGLMLKIDFSSGGIDLKNKDYNVISCSFFDLNVIRSAIYTVKQHNLYGYMQTIWDRAHEYPWIYLDSAILCGMPKNLWYEYGECSSIISGSVMRKVACGPKKYDNFGFNDVQFVKNTRQSN